MKIITTLIGLVIAAVLVICLLNMLGMNDVVTSAGNTIREKVGVEKVKNGGDTKSTDSDTNDFLERTLGWDIRDVKKKPVATVDRGIALLTAKIDELESLREEIKFTERSTGINGDKAEKERESLREVLRMAKEKITNPNTVYPLKIKTYTYTNREMLMASFSKMNARYQSLKASASYSANNPARAKQQVLKIDAQIRAARSALDLLKEKRNTGIIADYENKTDKTGTEVDSLSASATSILNEPVALPAGPATESERNEQEVLNFND